MADLYSAKGGRGIAFHFRATRPISINVVEVTHLGGFVNTVNTSIVCGGVLPGLTQPASRYAAWARAAP